MSHYHLSTGEPCDCGFNNETITKTALTWDELRNRKKLQKPEIQDALHVIEQNNLVNDRTINWIPWMLKEMQAGNIRVQEGNANRYQAGPNIQHAYVGVKNALPDGSTENEIYWDDLHARKWQHWTDWLNSRHPTRVGTDPQNMNVHMLLDKVHDWQTDMEAKKRSQGQKDGQVLHQFDDGWSLRNLTDKDHLKREGDAMGHCVGSYGSEVENGSLKVHSLRDEKGNPHVTYGIKTDDYNHPGGYAWQVYGTGNSEVKDEYADRIKQYWATQPDKETPLSEDYDEDDRYFHDVDDLRQWMEDDAETWKKAQDNPETDRDRHGFINTGTNYPVEPPDYEEMMKDAIPRDTGLYAHGPDYAHIEAIYNAAKLFGQIPQLASDLGRFQDAAQEEFDSYYEPWSVYHKDSGKELDHEFNPDFHLWDDIKDSEYGDRWREEMEKHGHEFTPEGFNEYQGAWEESHDEDRGYAEEENPKLDLTSSMYSLLSDHYDPNAGGYVNEVPQKAVAKTAYAHHWNDDGKICRCPWGLTSKEHLGKTSSKLEWLEGRPDMQTDRGKEIIQYLKGEREGGGGVVHYDYSPADKLLPWIAREIKKQRLWPSREYPHYLTCHTRGEPFEGSNDHGKDFNPDGKFVGEGPQAHHRDHVQFLPNEAIRVQKALEDMKKHNQGIDVMQHKAHELFPKIKAFRDWQIEQARPDMGEVLHDFGDGWTVRRLQDADEAKVEGQDMGHCVGSYGSRIEGGESLIASLRDEKNLPHATMELDPDHWVHKDDPEKTEVRPPLYTEDEEVQELWKGRLADPKSYVPQVGRGSHVAQFYGKEDKPPKEEYASRMREWLEPHGVHVDEPFEQWWDDEYVIPGPQNFDELQGYHDYGYYDNAPDEYHSACMEAEEHGLNEPELNVDQPNWGAVLDDLTTDYETQENTWRVKPVQVPHEPDDADYLWSAATFRDPHDGTRRPFENYSEGGWHVDSSEAGLRNAVNERHDTAVNEWEANGPYRDDIAARVAWEEHPRNKLLDYFKTQFGTHIDDEPYRPPYTPVPAPNQTMLFTHPDEGEEGYSTEQPGVSPWQDYGPAPPTYQHYGAADTAPLYFRWAFDPQKGVTLSTNSDDHDFRVPYHQDMGGSPKGGNGYATRIHGGWRITDWEHMPVDDPFIVNSVVKALNAEDDEPHLGSWSAPAYDWDRLHYGLPMPRLTMFED